MQAQKTKVKGMWLQVVCAGVLFCCAIGTAVSSDTMADYTAYPPLLNMTSSTNKPNVLVVFDNSNSMDEAPDGTPVGSTSPLSKSELARGAVKNLIQEFQGQPIRMGLMSFDQTPSDILLGTLLNGLYYVSYSSSNYDPTYTSTQPLWDWTAMPYEVINPIDGDYMYYEQGNRASYWPLPNQPATFCYSGTNTSGTGGYLSPPGNPPYDQYYCFLSKTGSSDYSKSNTSTANNTAIQAYSNPIDYPGTTTPVLFTFAPSDSDLEWGVSTFGQQAAFLPVGPTWTFITNPDPGDGFLDVPVATLTSTQASTLDSYLGTESLTTLANPQAPLVNVGYTPAPGALDSALKYFNGDLPDPQTSDNYPPPDAGSCGNNDYVVMVISGLPDETDPNLDSTGPNIDVATALQETDTEVKALKKAGITTFVVGFALPTGVTQTQYTELNTIAADGGSGQMYQASDQSGLQDALTKIFNDISNQTSSGTAAAVVTDSANGVGADYSAWYRPTLSDFNTSTGIESTVTWIGGLDSLFIGPYGYLREDSNGEVNGTYPLAGFQTDKIVKFQYDPTTQKTYVVRYDSTSNLIPQNLTAEAPAPLSSLKPIWNAEDPLAELTNVTTNRTNYTDNTDTGRYIFTWIDSPTSGTPGVVDPGEVTPFTTTALDGDNGWRYLAAPNGENQANNIIDYIRGEEISGYRNRSIDYKQTGTNLVWRLGDIIHSSIAVVGAPDADYAVANDDTTYAAFQSQYANRRQMVYVGANDGMLHAFNGGFWDSATESFNLTNASATATPDALGSEMWAYVPENLLPQLQWLTSPNYTHVYYMDGPIKTFSARIFTPDTEHPYGWGTVLVAGMRFGGGPYTGVDTTGTGTSTTMSSAYVIMDVTDPSQPPTLLAEVNDPNTASSTAPGMGFTTSMPAVVHAMTPDSSGSYVDPSTNQWYLVFGSGPTNLTDATSNQDAKLYVYNLNTLSWISGLSPLDITTQPDSFVGDLSAVDWNLDGVDDGVYFGTVGGTTSAPTGQLDRLVLNSTYSTTPGDVMSGVTVNTLLNPSQPFIAAPAFNTDIYGNRWVYDGTGRYLVVGDDSSDTQQSMYGVKEPVDSQGAMTWGTQLVSNMANVTGITAYADGSVSPAPTTVNNMTVNTVKDMEQAIQGMAGWYLNLTTSTNGSERILTSPFLFESTVNFITFEPSTVSCNPQGYSWLYSVDPLSGLAQPFAPLGYNSGVTDKNGSEESLNSVSLGYGMTFQSTFVHSAAEAANTGKIELNNSDRAQTTINLLGGTLVSGRRSWIQLPLN